MGADAREKPSIAFKLDNRPITASASADTIPEGTQSEGERRLFARLSEILPQVQKDPSMPGATRDLHNRTIVKKGATKNQVLNPNSKIYDDDILVTQPQTTKG